MNVYADKVQDYLIDSFLDGFSSIFIANVQGRVIRRHHFDQMCTYENLFIGKFEPRDYDVMIPEKNNLKFQSHSK